MLLHTLPANSAAILLYVLTIGHASWLVQDFAGCCDLSLPECFTFEHCLQKLVINVVRNVIMGNCETCAHGHCPYTAAGISYTMCS